MASMGGMCGNSSGSDDGFDGPGHRHELTPEEGEVFVGPSKWPCETCKKKFRSYKWLSAHRLRFEDDLHHAADHYYCPVDDCDYNRTRKNEAQNRDRADEIKTHLRLPKHSNLSLEEKEEMRVKCLAAAHRAAARLAELGDSAPPVASLIADNLMEGIRPSHGERNVPMANPAPAFAPAHVSHGPGAAQPATIPSGGDPAVAPPQHAGGGYQHQHGEQQQLQQHQAPDGASPKVDSEELRRLKKARSRSRERLYNMYQLQLETSAWQYDRLEQAEINRLQNMPIDPNLQQDASHHEQGASHHEQGASYHEQGTSHHEQGTSHNEQDASHHEQGASHHAGYGYYQPAQYPEPGHDNGYHQPAGQQNGHHYQPAQPAQQQQPQQLQQNYQQHNNAAYQYDPNNRWYRPPSQR